MVKRTVGTVAAVVLLWTSTALGQQQSASSKDPVTDGRRLSEWVKDLQTAAAPQTRNAAAYEISGLGPAAAPAVPALIKALDDPDPNVRYPVMVALREIGPAAEAAVPKLLAKMKEETNDELASAARRAIRHIKPEALPKEEEGDED